MVPVHLENPEDLSARAHFVLESADYIVVGDKERATRLLSSAGIKNDLLSFKEDPGQSDEEILNDLMLNHMSVAFILDAGTSCVSDPESNLLRKVIDRDIKVISVPGPSALLTVLAASGLDYSHFTFIGFIPPKGYKREDAIERIASEEYTVVFFESAQSLSTTLEDLEQNGLGDRRLTLACGQTKETEELLYLDVSSAVRYCENAEARGEYVLALEGASAFEERTESVAGAFSEEALEHLLRQLLIEGAGTKQAAKIIASSTGVEENYLYDLAQKIESDTLGGVRR